MISLPNNLSEKFGGVETSTRWVSLFYGYVYDRNKQSAVMILLSTESWAGQIVLIMSSTNVGRHYFMATLPAGYVA